MNDPALVNFQPIGLENLQFRHQNVQTGNEFWDINFARFTAQCIAKRPATAATKSPHQRHLNLASVVIDIFVESDVTRLRIGANESYRIHVSELGVNNTITVAIEAATIFGARHGIETLAQLIIYDDIRDVFLLRSDIRLEDGPVYSHRGISLDTARNFYPVDAIKRTIGKR